MSFRTHHILPYHDDVAAIASQNIVEAHADKLPDLSRIVVLVSHARAQKTITKLITRAAQNYGVKAIIPPFIGTLRDFAERNVYIADNVINDDERRFLLVDAIKQNNNIFPNANPWTLADALLELFDDLTLNEITITPNVDDFISTLERSYGCESGHLSGLGMEAQAIHQLWIAWHHELRARAMLDRNTAYLMRLPKIDKKSADHFYILEQLNWLPAELKWLRQQLHPQNAQLYFSSSGSASELHPDSAVRKLLDELQLKHPPTPSNEPFSLWIDTVFNQNEGEFAARARKFASLHPNSPANKRLACLPANSFEQEAAAIDVRIRELLLDNPKRIGLVIENRVLARRVRALLERANIVLQDASGWALSTTSAAAVLESWLQCLEEDFAYQPLLDVLKSPFCKTTPERREAVFHLESDIMHFENIARDLERYRTAARARAQRLHADDSALTTELVQTIDFVANAAEPLLTLHRSNIGFAHEYVSACLDSLDRLGIVSSFTNDAAGVEVIALLQRMSANLLENPVQLDWLEFRAWLGETLEAQRFIPPIATSGNKVELLSLAQTALNRYDHIIIGGLTREYLPGNSPRSPFFNRAVRRELGLSANHQDIEEKLHRFRCLLEAAPSILLTFQSADADAGPSPWVELIQAFHKIGYGNKLVDKKLVQWTQNQDIEIATETLPLPLPEAAPAAKLPANRLPKRLSASRHQSIVNCPFAFFAGSGLQLQAPEEIRELLSKHEYGERVHTCLQAFHKGVPGLPGPFSGPINTTNRHQAIELLTSIAETVFQKDIEDSFHHRGWLADWLNRIPQYVEWQRKRFEQHWRVTEVEHRAESALTDKLAVYGRIDRIDTGDDGLAILDYKTGTPPSASDVKSGESVQLPHYAIAVARNVAQVEYVDLQSEKIAAKHTLAGQELNELTNSVSERLQTIWQMLENEHPLNAWGDRKACGYCQFDGLCRKGTWLTDSGITTPTS